LERSAYDGQRLEPGYRQQGPAPLRARLGRRTQPSQRTDVRQRTRPFQERVSLSGQVLPLGLIREKAKEGLELLRALHRVEIQEVAMAQASFGVREGRSLGEVDEGKTRGYQDRSRCQPVEFFTTLRRHFRARRRCCTNLFFRPAFGYWQASLR